MKKKHADQQSWIKKIALEIVPPSLGDNTADVDRLIKGIKRALKVENLDVDFHLIKSIPRKLRDHDYQVAAIVYHNLEGDPHLIDVIPMDEENRIYGVAVDLGSSTIVLRLLDLETGEEIAERSFLNPQIKIGADILTRIHYATQTGSPAELQKLLIDRLTEEIQLLVNQQRISNKDIVGLAVAGNTTMTHFFLGLDPYMICREPYIPVVNKLDMIRARELGVNIHSEAPVLIFPNVGSYFGGDLISGILASGMHRQSDISFLVDVGTNAEVVIGNSEWLMACAGAAGPALEGGVAAMGMMAGPGVIDKLVIDADSLEFHIHTIEDIPAVGICGSGLIDLTAQLFLSGMIDIRAKFVAARCGRRLGKVEGIDHLMVVPAEATGTGKPLMLSQPDIDALIRSKAAMYTILTTISNTVNIAFEEVARFFVAGTFGTYIDPRSAITLGMIPDLPINTYLPMGNTSLKGAASGLLSSAARDEIFLIRDRITYLELNVNQEFMNLFSAAKFLPHTDRSLFPSVKMKKN